MSYASFFVAWLKCIYYLLLFKTGLPRAIERMATAHMWSSFSAVKFDRKKSVSLQTKWVWIWSWIFSNLINVQLSMWICQGGMLCSYLTVLFIDAKVHSIQFILCTTWCLLGGRNEVGRSRRKYHRNCINDSPPSPHHPKITMPSILFPQHYLCIFALSSMKSFESFLSFLFLFFSSIFCWIIKAGFNNSHILDQT